MGYIKIVPRDDVELSDEQIARNDQIDNSVFECLEALAETQLDWDMELIGEATDSLKAVMADHDIRVRHPGVTYSPTGIQYVTEFD